MTAIESSLKQIISAGGIKMKTLHTLLTILGVTFILSGSAGAFSFESVPFETVEKGFFSSIREEYYTVVDGETQWVKLWLSHRGNEELDQIPKVDFDNEIVIATFMGEKPTNGYEITIYNIVNTPERISRDLFAYRTAVLIDRQETEGLLPVLTSPFHIVKIDRSDFNEVLYSDHRYPARVISEGYTIDVALPDRNVLINDQESFNRIWDVLYGERPTIAPVIDFDEYTVVALSAGSSPNPGWYIDLHSIWKVFEHDFESTVVNVDEGMRRGIFPQVIVYPYQLVLTQKIEGDVLFNESTVR
jgi:hypothetical protein